MEQSRRPGRDARDVHATIPEKAEHLKASAGFRISAADTCPECAALLHSAREQGEAVVPAAFEFEGRRYWLRVRLRIQLEVFDSPSAGVPLLAGASLNAEGFGHAPGH